MADKIFLSVPFNEKDSAKQLGAKWDTNKSLWYIDSKHTNKHTVEARWPLVTILVGEDRNFGGSLFIDLIPRTMWFANVRSSVTPRDWDRLRHLTYLRANHKCELCNATDVKLDAHERFEYNTINKTQTLKRLIALCKKCHEATHIGLTMKISTPEHVKETIDHFKKVTKMSDAEYAAHHENAFKVWNERSKIDWELDLNMLIINGIKTLTKDEIKAKIEKKKEDANQPKYVYDDSM